MRRRTARCVAIAVALACGMAVVPLSVVSASGFPDVPAGHQFGVPIAWAVDQRITTGYDDGMFRPTESVSRQALAAFMYRADATGDAQPACEGDAPFSDVPVSHPFCGHIEWLVGEGLATGFDDGTFRPTAAISRQAMAAFLARAELGESVPACDGDAPFSDVSVSHPFCGHIEWLVGEGLATGFDDGTFRPTDAISRQAAATFLWRRAGEPTGSTVRVSVAEDGTESEVTLLGGAISGNGNTVAFRYPGTKLVPGVSGDVAHLLVHDLDSGVTTRITEAIGGGEPDASVSPTVSLSHDGQVVAFLSAASDLVPDTTNDAPDVFVHDRTAGTIERVSLTSDGDEIDDVGLTVLLSADGRHVVFSSESSLLGPGITNDVSDIFVHDRVSGTTERVSVATGGDEANDHSWPDGVSADGRYITFTSMATNLVPEDTGDDWQVFVRDRVAGTTELVSVNSDGQPAAGHQENQGLGISADGRVALFRSRATNLVDDDTGGDRHVYVRDRVAGVTELVSVAPGGAPANDSSSGANHALSSDGRYVLFTSSATDLVPGVTNDENDVFVRDRVTGTTERVSVSTSGAEATGGNSSGLGISADGSRVLIGSSATNLVPDVTNETTDLYVRTRYGVR
ncbi:MAG: S-layer homology domain-containing protein [Acidimicrobiia bacterium]|nr:S-layer homology domain-containing protein [Acidimicrobiia bacterium]